MIGNRVQRVCDLLRLKSLDVMNRTFHVVSELHGGVALFQRADALFQKLACLICLDEVRNVGDDQTEAMTLGTRIVVMKDGVVQQVDTPQNLYQKPGNLFVAGFMGSPQMNFLDAVISEKGGNLIAKVGEHELVIPAAKAKALKDGGYVGKTVVLGIRPEDIHDSQMFIEASPSAPMTSVVKVYELLGAEVFLYFDVNGTQVTARVDPRTTAKTGDPIKFAFDMEKSHFFDKETELTICN